MAWTDTARRQHMRDGPGFPSDLRDGEWALIEPMFPGARSGGRRRTTCLRAVMDAIVILPRAVVPGGCCPKASRRFRRFVAISTPGGTVVLSRHQGVIEPAQRCHDRLEDRRLLATRRGNQSHP